MILKLENEILEVSIENMGAQLTSIKGKKDNIEYLWTADPKYWGRHSPILFPIVGKVKNNQYRIEDKVFNLNQHGFVRNCDFTLIEEKDDRITYRLTSNEETLERYPYKFQLDVEYILIENSLEIIYRVRNIDDKDVFFSIGAHPGFNCPLMEGETMEDYYLEFSEKETVNRELIDAKVGLYTGESEELLKNESKISLKKELFKDDALVFKNLKSNRISLKNNKNNKVITVDFKGFPYLGVWSQSFGAPFVCIEPWYGHADFIDFDGDFREKEGIMKLGVEEEFECKHCIIVE
ncbi:aldose 1-epimerase family protein [Clostridium sp. ZS2-4]|uniref:aldose 1-epimerase family protein n=1 Tax=Clostridium sp. ZS2-4 TaxID=2987703 RepID=UPI00227CDC91|nr:aldose 1-epimerase family protein [Clostridium sp. ZS2-4]MCY6356512.1 aldose 1-epimerase family protein [Clostridium sp. ZS2-4]